MVMDSRRSKFAVINSAQIMFSSAGLILTITQAYINLSIINFHQKPFPAVCLHYFLDFASYVLCWDVGGFFGLRLFFIFFYCEAHCRNVPAVQRFV